MDLLCFLHEHKPYLNKANSFKGGGQAHNLLGSRSGSSERTLERGATFKIILINRPVLKGSVGPSEMSE